VQTAWKNEFIHQGGDPARRGGREAALQEHPAAQEPAQEVQGSQPAHPQLTIPCF